MEEEKREINHCPAKKWGWREILRELEQQEFCVARIEEWGRQAVQ